MTGAICNVIKTNNQLILQQLLFHTLAFNPFVEDHHFSRSKNRISSLMTYHKINFIYTKKLNQHHSDGQMKLVQQQKKGIKMSLVK